RLAELVRNLDPWAVWYDPKGPAGDVGDECLLTGLDLHPATFDDVTAAAPRFLRGLADRTTRYRPHPAMDTAAEAVIKTEVGDRWLVGRAQNGRSATGGCGGGASKMRWSRRSSPLRWRCGHTTTHRRRSGSRSGRP